MRTLRRRSGALPVGALLLLLAAAPAQAQGDRPAVVGGTQLASNGVVVAPTAPALPPEISAASWLVADLDTGQVLAAKDPHGRYAPASTLKALTALALLPEVEKDRAIVPTYDDVAVEGSKVGLVEHVAYPAEELFAAMLMVSGNDAANALATSAGGLERTAELMNARARELNALDTRAVNPSGLDAEGQVSSAYDLALLARAGLDDADFARYVSTRKGSVGAPPGKARIETYNKNKLLLNYEGALGIKNGYTVAARASFIGAAEREGRRLVVTLMRADPRVHDEAARLLDWGFSALTTAAPVGQLVAPAEPVEPAVPTAAGADGDEATTVLGPATSEVAVVDEGGFPAGGVTLGLMTLAGLVALRRRQVVVAQRKRRRQRERAAAQRREVAERRRAQERRRRPPGAAPQVYPGEPRESRSSAPAARVAGMQ